MNIEEGNLCCRGDRYISRVLILSEGSVLDAYEL